MTDNNDYAAAHERYAQNVQTAEQQQRLSGVDPNTGMPPGQSHPSQIPAPTVNQELLKQAEEMQTHKDAEGKRPYIYDSEYRNRVEAIRAQAYSDSPVPVTQQQPAQQPVEPPQGNPQERADADLNERLDSGNVILPGSVDDATWDQLSAGYNLSTVLPPGFGIDAYGAEQLYAARQAGLTEQQVQSVIAQLVKAQQ